MRFLAMWLLFDERLVVAHDESVLQRSAPNVPGFFEVALILALQHIPQNCLEAFQELVHVLTFNFKFEMVVAESFSRSCEGGPIWCMRNNYAQSDPGLFEVSYHLRGGDDVFDEFTLGKTKIRFYPRKIHEQMIEQQRRTLRFSHSSDFKCSQELMIAFACVGVSPVIGSRFWSYCNPWWGCLHCWDQAMFLVVFLFRAAFSRGGWNFFHFVGKKLQKNPKRNP